MYQALTGIILSGGKSTRMGTNKAFMEVKGVPLIKIIYQRLAYLFPKLIIVTNEPELYSDFDCKIVTDIFKHKGPLAGIHSGLVNSVSERNFIISCDMPFVDEKAIRFILDYNSQSHIVVPEAEGYVQELCGIYSRSLIVAMESVLSAGKHKEIRHHEQKHRACKVHDFIHEQNAKIINFETEYPEFTPYLFFNMNSPEDYRFVIENKSFIPS